MTGSITITGIIRVLSPTITSFKALLAFISFGVVAQNDPKAEKKEIKSEKKEAKMQKKAYNGSDRKSLKKKEKAQKKEDKSGMKEM